MGTPDGQTLNQMSSSLPVQRALQLLNQAGPKYKDLVLELGELAQRVKQGTFHLAVLGQFKRGKSTLINALLGKKLLPTSILPLTAIPTFIRFGMESRVEIHYIDPQKTPDAFDADTSSDLLEILQRYVTEKNNPENRLGVNRVDVFTQAPILQNGTVLIDTPGVGSTFEHNTRTTMDALPKVDAALFVVSVDPPVTKAELDFLARVRTGVPTLFFILNKTDTLSPQEQQDAKAFLQQVLREQIGNEVRVFPVSAKQGLIARQQNDPEAWETSGMHTVEAYINEFLKANKDRALLRAARIKYARVIEMALLRLQTEKAGLSMPLADLDQKIALFKEKAQEVRQRSSMVEDLVEGEKRRILKHLEDRCEKMRKEARQRLHGHVEDAIQGFDAKKGRKTETMASGLYAWVEDGLFEIIPDLFGRQFNELHQEFSSMIQEAIKRHYQQAADLIRLIRQNAAELFDIPLYDPDSIGEFQAPGTPYWSAREWHSRLGPIPSGVFDKFLPGGMVRKMVKKRMDEDIVLLVNKNVENIRWPMVQAITDTFAAFVSRLDKEVEEVIEGTNKAMELAMELRQKRGNEVNERLQVLERAIAGLQAILNNTDRTKQGTHQ